MTYNCPFCGDNSYKTLKKGSRTRCCDEEVIRVNGAIYARKEDAPEWRIIDEYIQHKRQYHNLGHYTILWGSREYKNHALPAAKDLLKKCGGDLGLAIRVIEISFTDDSHKRRQLANMFALTSNYYFPEALAKAKRKADVDDIDRSTEDHFASAPIFA